MELLGLTRDDNPYIYLSDGGHFENLALYEMVRRRCRLIVLSDAGCDPDFAFEDLGNAVRKISLDLGINIEFKGIEKMRRRPMAGSKAEPVPGVESLYAIGVVDYPGADDVEGDKPSEKGIILYIKPSYYPDVIKNVGVRNYAVANPDFPHQSTSDQWFDEPQFESYRALGFEVMDTVLSGAVNELIGKEPITLEAVLDKLLRKLGD
jgi:hypothetical protein